MPAYMKLGHVKGEATDTDHSGWIIIGICTTSVNRYLMSSSPIDMMRMRGYTSLSDVCITREVDKSSTKLMEACANGTFFAEVELHFCTTVKNRQEPYLTYKLFDVIVSYHSASFNSSGDPLPTESVSLGYSKAEWTYIVVDPKTGHKTGHVPAKYHPAEGRS